MLRREILKTLSIACLAWVAAAPAAAEVVLRPGDDVQAAIDAAPEGEIFTLRAGVYRQQWLRPKNGQQFLGESGAVLSGAMVLDEWSRDGDAWVAGGLPDPRRLEGHCRDDTDLCRYREDLFVDGELYQRVLSRQELAPGRWFYSDNKAYLAEDPAGRLVEVGVTPRAFGGEAVGVVLRDLTVEKYAVAAQYGAIDLREAIGWQLIDVTARWNHGIGLYLGPDVRVRGGSFSHNGQMGIGGDGDGAVINGAEIAHNNYAKFSAGWEAGGTKFVRSENLTVRNTCVHHNDGPGLWTDIDNIQILYEGNKVFENAGDGIKHEISYDAIIRDNVVARNGAAKHNWLWGSQILIQNSPNVEVYGNVVETGPDFGNAVGIVNQDRGEGEYGPRISVDNHVHDNRIVILWPEGRTGIVTDHREEWFWENANNTFDRNHYIVPGPDLGFWGYGERFQRWEYIRERGLESEGTLEVDAERQPMALSCE